ncbi:hypothetical protein VKT23_016673 [Stygiomarasmius scandens]|uniref:Uncharacterized protein n=1 Tax=Marasmiellus scandens TaxID=2682957 RepID=A0ABR1IUC6_9AGAR
MFTTDPSLLQIFGDEEEGGKQTGNKEKNKRQKKGRKKKSTEVVEEEPVGADEPQSSGSPEPQSPAPDHPRPKPRPRALTPTLPDGWNLHPETQAYLKTLSDDDRRKTLREIRGHSQANFDRSNNIYKMKFLLKEVDKKHERMANQSSSTPAPNNENWGDEIAARWARASGQSLDELIDIPESGVSSRGPSLSPLQEATSSAPSTTSTVLSITAPEDAYTILLSVAPQTDSLPFPGPASPLIQTSAQPVPSTTPIASTSEHGDTTALRSIVPCSSGPLPVLAAEDKVVSVPGVDKTGWPAWLSSAFDIFSGVNSLRGEVLWSCALKDWTDLERKYSFVNPVGAAAFYSAVSRPELISWWSKNGKKVREEPPDIMADVVGFHESFWNWWLMINPQWRERDGNGRLVSIRQESKDNDGWDCMCRPGQCGILTILLCLFYWFLRLGSDEEWNKWKEALEDVSWVLQRMNKATKRKPKKRTIEEAVEPQPPAKRLRSRAQQQ